MIKLFLLSAGTNACYHIAKHLKQDFPNEFELFGADTNESFLIPSYPYLDKIYRVPPSIDPAYYQHMLAIFDETKPQFVLPSFDLDQQLFYDGNPDLTSRAITSLGIPDSTRKFYQNKLAIYQTLAETGLPVPQLFTKKSVKENDTYCLKPLTGVGSVGVCFKTGKEIQALTELDDFLIQSCCHGPEFTVECFIYDKQFSAVSRQRLATKSGVCTKTKITAQPQLVELAKKFAQVIQTPHFFNLQFMQNAQGQWVITDVNLRLAGGMGLSHAAGWNETAALAQLMKGNVAHIFDTLPIKLPEQYVVKAYTDIVTKCEKAVIAFDLDGTLLDSRKRHIAVLSDVLQRHGITLDITDLVSFKRNGKNNVDFLQQKGLSLEVAQKIQQDWICHIEDDIYLKQDCVYPTAKKMLESYNLDERILVTARKDKQLLLQQLQDVGLSSYFSQVYVVTPGKDASRAKAKILQETGAVRFIGDTASDWEAAQLAGCQFEHLDHGFHDKNIVLGETL